MPKQQLPNPENMALDFLNGLISALMAGGVVAAEAYIESLSPGLLEAPVIGFIIKRAVVWLGHVISISGQKFGDKLVISIQTGSQKENVLSTGTALAIAQASGDEKAIAQAVQTMSKAWEAAIKYDGWGRPL